MIFALIVTTNSPSTLLTRILSEDIDRHQDSSAHRERSGKSIAVPNEWLAQPGLERHIEPSGYRRRSFLAAHAETPDMRPRVVGDSTSIKADQLRDSHPCLHGCQLLIPARI